MIRISQGGSPSTTITITQQQGEQIRGFLEKNIDSRFSNYCREVGIEYTNIVAMLGGRKPLSIKTLNKLFSKLEVDIECRIEFIIQKRDGITVDDARSTNLEEQLFLEGMGDVTEEQ